MVDGPQTKMKNRVDWWLKSPDRQNLFDEHFSSGKNCGPGADSKFILCPNQFYWKEFIL